jgi:uncharacterized RDD family membrane protein YckC
MDPQELEDARARLEQDYLAGSISADEYTRLRRQLHETASAPESEPEPQGFTAREDERPIGFHGVVPSDADPVTGAPLAAWGRRAAGWFVDLMVYIGAWVAVFLWSFTTEDPLTGETSGAADFITSVVLFFGPTLYQWLMVGRWGQTLGKMAVGIRVVRSDDADRVSYLRALGRAASVWILGLLFLPLLLAYLWPLWDRRNQTLYDKMASTIVVKDRSGVGLPPVL